ncbi:MAG TPA: M48 family metallopeptidase [Candidatus Saccharimonadales bacterium]|nr:M48 family metallopeptidase [Candidatus Saccharimonadales bacterium]
MIDSSGTNLGRSSVPADSAEARSYNRILRRLGIADLILGVALMVLVLASDWTSDFRNFAIHIGGDHHVIALFVYTTILLLLAKFFTVGLDYYSFLIEHRYHLSNQRLRGWIWDQVKSFALGFLISQLLVQLIYLLIRLQPQWWWVTGWALFMLFTVFMAHIAPVLLFPLFFRFHALADDELTSRLTRLSEKAGARVRGVYEWMLSEKTKKANAALMGLGRTRRIVISDTLLSTCDHDEIEAVLAHELGHHVYRHLLKGIVVQGVITFFGFWCLKLAIRWASLDWNRHYAQIDFANLPLMILVVTALSVLLLPVMNAYSRFNERQADLYAWKSLGSVRSFCSAMEKLAAQNLSEREPSRFVEILFHSHPATGRRMKAALAWAASQK